MSSNRGYAAAGFGSAGQGAAAAEQPKGPGAPLLQLEDLCTYFFAEQGAVAKAVDGVSYSIPRGQTLGLVGESGSGKSVTALSIMRLVPAPPGRITAGRILFDGRDLTQNSEAEMRKLRGSEISMVFQEPMTALNPVFTVGEQIAETVRLHEGLDKRAARRRALDMLIKVGIPSPEVRLDNYPHELSGGMRQRVMIAMAMACNPKLLIADEPTTALDVTIQAQILELIRDLQRERGMSVLLITHSLGVVAENADQVAVMYAGKVVEFAPVLELFERPKHPYTLGLFRSLPDLAEPKQRLATIPGIVPSPFAFPSGCRFRTRCPIASERCRTEEPKLSPVLSLEPDKPSSVPHTVACHHWREAQGL